MSRETIDREHVGRLMHESWSRTKRAQGLHGPWDKCPQTFECCHVVFVEGEKRYMQSKPCEKFHADLIPWDDLPENQKDINRHAFDDVFPYFERLLAAECQEAYDEMERVEECGHVFANIQPNGCLVCRLLADERERVREMCIHALVFMRDEAEVKYAEAGAITSASYEHGAAAGLIAAIAEIRQLDLTKDLAPSSTEEGRG